MRSPGSSSAPWSAPSLSCSGSRASRSASGSRARPSGRVRPAVMIGIAAVIAIAAAGPFAALGVSAIVLTDPIVILGQVPISLASLHRVRLPSPPSAPFRRCRPIPELLIASGAACATIPMGVSWWLFYLEPSFETFAWLSAASSAGLLVLGAGFWSGTLFWPVERPISREARALSLTPRSDPDTTPRWP